MLDYLAGVEPETWAALGAGLGMLLIGAVTTMAGQRHGQSAAGRRHAVPDPLPSALVRLADDEGEHHAQLTGQMEKVIASTHRMEVQLSAIMATLRINP